MSESNYLIKKNSYYIEIKPKNSSDKIKERINRRIASKNLRCDECYQPILKGDEYIRDKFWWHDDFFFVKKTVNFVCLSCWKGQIPIRVSTNFT